MYINPIIFGVLATLFVELIGIIAIAIITTDKEDK